MSAPGGELEEAFNRILDKVLRTVLAPWRTLVASTLFTHRKSAESHLSYRRCPKCGERDLRLSDRHRPEPIVYQSRIFVQKWLCLSCGYRESETIEEMK